MLSSGYLFIWKHKEGEVALNHTRSTRDNYNFISWRNWTLRVLQTYIFFLFKENLIQVAVQPVEMEIAQEMFLPKVVI